MIKADEKIKRAKMEKNEQMRRAIEEEIKEPQKQKAAKDSRNKRYMPNLSTGMTTVLLDIANAMS